ncbi:FAD-binding domain-containing protein [Prochlorococcus marinus]|uniref:FAD-binding domain-containing protein n=1 Tax=Prochlorococcus marinus TaxID=1219 RepID=UPI0022B5283D|nr:FAD-binding domain-containing protein [Prochlorococcus marinus]
MNIFEEANDVLDTFIINHLISYHQLRNYDFGIKKRTNVSQISKYTSHRILYEYAIVEKLKRIDKKKKYTDEILWRIYWKGYLENYKSIWFEYINFKEYPNNSNLISAMDGKTGIDCFDTWIEELRENNYLHNHSRMWFASIWIFTLGLPWQLGARFFMKHLFDGDASSNTLSWRWVAGMHTNNKPYLASKENINKYTINRFRNTSISRSNKIKPIKSNKHQSNKLPVQRSFSNSNILLMFDNDMNILNRSKLFNSYCKVYILSNGITNNRFGLSEKVSQFKLGLIDNINKLIPNSEIFESRDIEKFLCDHRCIDVIYPGVGHNLDLINKYANQNQIIINYIYREEDLKYWNYANSGFYRFKSSFHRINKI